MVVALAVCMGCVAPPAPVSPTTPSPERFQHAADPDPAVRARTTAELAADPSGAASTMLVTLVQRDIDPKVRVMAAAAIADRRDPTLEGVLEASAAGDPDPDVRLAATAAHERLWPWRKQPRTAGGLSLLCPGCGQLYLRQYGEGAAFLGTTAALVAGGIALMRGHTVTSLSGPVDSARVPAGLLMITTAQNEWFYSIFDAYRDERVLRDDAGYKFAITRETLPELVSAPFRPRVLASPWVWGGVPIALGAGLAITYLMSRDELTGNPNIRDIDGLNVLGHRFSRWTGFAAGEGYYAGLFASVGVGEEALFRGFIQTELEERLGTWGGLALASAIFGTIHLTNYGTDPKAALVAIPVIATLGSSLGLAYIHTGHRLETSVAMHFWYDFLLSTAAFAADPTHQPFVVQYGTTM
jgi:membrane protease YdiL (CAAX protease family)